MRTIKPVEAEPRTFTVEEANSMLPLLKLVVGDIVRQFEVVQGYKDRLSSIQARGRKPAPGDPYWEEVAQMRSLMEAEEAKLTEYADELSRLGVELKAPDGLCDFPSKRDDRLVYLCWRLGEPSVSHWHELDAGFSGRQALK